MLFEKSDVCDSSQTPFFCHFLTNTSRSFSSETDKLKTSFLGTDRCCWEEGLRNSCFRPVGIQIKDFQRPTFRDNQEMTLGQLVETSRRTRRYFSMTNFEYELLHVWSDTLLWIWTSHFRLVSLKVFLFWGLTERPLREDGLFSANPRSRGAAASAFAPQDPLQGHAALQVLEMFGQGKRWRIWCLKR